MKTKEDCYNEATLKSLGNNPQGTRMDVVYLAMDIYTAEQNSRIKELEEKLSGNEPLSHFVPEKIKSLIWHFLCKDLPGCKAPKKWDDLESVLANTKQTIDSYDLITDDLRNKIKELESSLAKATQTWIPVEKKLPEKPGYYLAWDQNSFFDNKTEMLRYDTYNGSWSNGYDDKIHPSHWMPLPLPPGSKQH